VYRRGPEQMSAFSFEYEHARDEGVKFLWHVLPIRIYGDRAVEGIELVKLVPAEDGSLIPQPDSEFSIETDLVVLSIGQGTHAGFLSESGKNAKVELERGRILIDRATGQTSNPKFFAGGDCTNGGREVVDAVADGKRAGIGIAAWLEVQHVQA
jgi:dihydropyrimidine dehydrogenase (NAD+) subunit PreT